MTDFLVPMGSTSPPEPERPPALSSWVLRITDETDRRIPRLRQAPQVLAAMQKLVEMIQQVRSPDGGWHHDRPPTPENLLPYVTEEASDLLDVLESTLDSLSRRPGEGAESWLSQELWQNYCLAEDFAPQLLWGIARSAYGVMRLLEGVRAVVGEGEERSPGILRLAALLHIRIADYSQTIDLVTHHPPEVTIADTTPIQLIESVFMAEPQPAGEVLQGFVQQIRMTTPAVLSFLDGVRVTALTPQHPWQAGTLQLQMGLEFVPDREGVRSLPADPTSTSNHPILKFTDTVWLEAYRTTVLQHYLATLIPQLSAYQSMAKADLPPLSEEILPLLIQNGCEVADLLEQAPPFLGQRSTEDGVPLADLLPWLLWCVSRSAYEVMHFIGGLRCRLLQPKQEWQSGLLRLLLTLKVSTTEQDWYFDLATGLVPEPDVFPLDPDVVVQFPGRLGNHQPCLIEYWQSRVMTAIETATPELRLLMEGTAVDLLTDEPEAAPALVQLLVDFDFLADSSI